jgi:hypothetical protein
MKETTDKDIELQRVQLDRERLTLEKQGSVIRYLTLVGSVVAFGWTIVHYLDTVNRDKDKELSTKRITASKPFLDLQLKLYAEATQTASYIANNPDSAERKQRITRFLELYWGELALVERGKVASAMKAYKSDLDSGTFSTLPGRALDIAHACRDELAKSWELDLWLRDETPNQAMQRTASKSATDAWRVCHPRFGCVAHLRGLAAADLESR